MAPALVLTGAAGWFGRALLDRLRREPGLLGGGPVRVVVAAPLQVPDVLAVHPVSRSSLATSPTRIRGPALRGRRRAFLVHAAGVIHPAASRTSSRSTRTAPAWSWTRRQRPACGAWSTCPRTRRSAPTHARTTSSATRSPTTPTSATAARRCAAELAVRAARRRLETVDRASALVLRPVPARAADDVLHAGPHGTFPDRRRRRHSGARWPTSTTSSTGSLLAERVPAAAGQAYWIADARAVLHARDRRHGPQALREEGYDVSPRSAPRCPARALSASPSGSTARLQAGGVYHQEMHVLGEMDKTIACDISHHRRASLATQPGSTCTRGCAGHPPGAATQGIAL